MSLNYFRLFSLLKKTIIFRLKLTKERGAFLKTVIMVDKSDNLVCVGEEVDVI